MLKQIQHDDDISVESRFTEAVRKAFLEFEGLNAIISMNGNSRVLGNLSNIIRKSYGSYFLGCGSASYVSMAGSYLFAKIAKRHINFAIGSEFGYHLDFLTEKSLDPESPVILPKA